MKKKEQSETYEIDGKLILRSHTKLQFLLKKQHEKIILTKYLKQKYKI